MDTNTTRKFSPGLFGAILVCFFLPFITMSCGAQDVSLSGVQLATGLDIGQRRLDPNPLVDLALLAALIGLVIGFVRWRALSLLSMLLGLAGAALLWLLKALLDAEALQYGSMLRLRYDAGYWLSFVLFVAAAALNGVLFFGKRNEP
jgi:hypothetical protein